MTGMRTWKLWAATLAAWVVLDVLGQVVLPHGGFRDYLWPIMAGVIVLTMGFLVLPPGQRRSNGS